MSGKILVMGHRGWDAEYPENTLVSFRAGLDLGIDIIEFDVMQSSDGVPVVIHDDTFERTTDGHGKVCASSFSELRKLDAGSWKNPRFKGEKIPTLEETLNLMLEYPSVLLNVEVKDCTRDTALKCIDALKSFGVLERSVLTCFSAEVLHFIKALNPAIKVQGFPSKMHRDFRRGKNGTFSIMDYIGIYVGDANYELVQCYRDIGIICGVWCVDDEKTMEKVLSVEGISIVTSNAPDRIIKYLEGRNLR